MIKRIFKESVLYAVAGRITLFGNLLVLPLITPFLTSEDYGIYGLTFAYMAALRAFGLMGFKVLFNIAYFKYHEEYKELWGKYWGILVLWRLIYTFLVVLILYLILRSRIPPDTIWIVLFLVTSPLIFFSLCFTIGTRLCQFKEDHQKVYMGTFYTGVITVTVTFISIYYYQLGYIGFFLAGFVSSIFQFLYYGYILWKEKIRPTFNIDWAFFKKSFKIAVPFVPHQYSGFLTDNSDRLVMDYYRLPIGDIGQYNIAYSFGNYFSSFNNAITTVISPIYFKLYAKKSEETEVVIKNITFLWTAFTIAIGFLMSIWAKEVFTFLYRNPELSEAYVFTTFILMSFTYRPMYSAIMARLIFEEKTASMMKISAAAGVINLVLNLIFVPQYGIQAAILSTFVCFLYQGFAGFYFKDTRQYITLDYYPISTLLLIIGISVFAYVLMDVFIWQKILITGGMGLLGLGLYRKYGAPMVKLLNQYD